MLSLEAMPRLEAASWHCFSFLVLVLVLVVTVLLTSRGIAKKSALLTYKRPTVTTGSAIALTPEEILVKYITAINMETFDPERHPHVYTSEEYSAIRPLISRLFCIPPTSAPVERVFSRGEIIMRPHRAKMSDDVHEMMMYLRCSGY